MFRASPDRSEHAFVGPGGAALLLVLATLLGAAGGCTQFRNPRARFGEMRLVERGEARSRVEVDVLVSNPNKEAIGLREFRYSFVVGSATYAGRRSVNATVGAGASSRFVVPAIVETAVVAAADGDVRWRLDGTLHYETPGEIAEILLDAGVRRPKVGVRGEGTWLATPAAEQGG